MNSESKLDIVTFLGYLVKALNAIGKTKKIDIGFTHYTQSEFVYYNATVLVSSFSNLMCEIIGAMEPGNEISVRLTKENDELEVQISTNCVLDNFNKEGSVQFTSYFERVPSVSGIAFSQKFNTDEARIPAMDAVQTRHEKSKELPEFYSEIRKRLRSHFTKSDNLISFLQIHHPADAAFLKNVNDIIDINIDNDQFTSLMLASQLHMSRTQLFRRMKPIIQQAPAAYIKSFKLQKAKSLLETTKLSIAEVCYRTGFQSQSHFSKAFNKQFGLCPSHFRRNKMEQFDKCLQQSNQVG